jgi:hypothetical protein
VAICRGCNGLQRSMHFIPLRSQQLRRLRKRLFRTDPRLHPGDMRQLPAAIYSL